MGVVILAKCVGQLWLNELPIFSSLQGEFPFQSDNKLIIYYIRGMWGISPPIAYFVKSSSWFVFFISTLQLHKLGVRLNRWSY